MRAMSCRRLLLAAAGFLALPTQAAAQEAAVVWLTAEVRSAEGRADIRLPLQWLAESRPEGNPTLRIREVRLDCAELWATYRGLAVGETREVASGVTEDKTRYVVHAESLAPDAKSAEGKVRIVSRDENGREVDVRFPLSVAKVLDGISRLFPQWDMDSAVEDDESGFSLSGPMEFTKLGDYGRFTFLEARDKNSRVRVTIE
jgi:hypothetical protein